MRTYIFVIYILAGCCVSGCLNLENGAYYSRNDETSNPRLSRQSFSNASSNTIDNLGLRDLDSFRQAMSVAPVPLAIPERHQSYTNAYAVGFREGYAFCNVTTISFINSFEEQIPPNEFAYMNGWLDGQLFAQQESVISFFERKPTGHRLEESTQVSNGKGATNE